MAEDSEDKTELPTDHKRQEVREQGNVARSADLNSAALVLAAAASMHFFGADIAGTLVSLLRKSLSSPAWTSLDPRALLQYFWFIGETLFRSVLPFLCLMVASSIAINIAQVGFMLNGEALQFKLSRINPLEGFKRIVSMQGVVRLLGSVLKLVVLTSIAAGFISTQMAVFLHAIDAETSSLCREMGGSLVTLSFQLALALAVLALMDYGFQLWKFEQDIKMTKQEIRDEMRHMDGDPHIRQRRKEAHRKMVDSQQVHKVKEADVIVTNPTHIAVALKYTADKMAAPIVLAKGMGVIAERIRHMAAEHGIPIVEKKPLARALYRDVKVGHPVPVELYEAVAEILAYVFRLNKKYPGKRR